MKPTRVELMPFGVSISFKLHLKDYNNKILKASWLEIKKIIVATSGPAINLFVILLIKTFNINFIDYSIAIYANILIILFNLLPIYPLDGGRILKSIIHIAFGGRLAKIVTNKIANYAMILITIIGSIGVFYFENISIFLVIVFLWILVIRENRKYEIIIKAYNNL